MRTLSDLARQLNGGRPLAIELGDFLDAFYRAPSAEAFREPPLELAGRHPQGALYDAFLAAVAEDLGRRHGLALPAWVFAPNRYLACPYFAIEAPSFRATLLLESPAAFRARNLFVTANALSRASQQDSTTRLAKAS